MNFPMGLVLDTDILSALMRNDPEVISYSRKYLEAQGFLTFSIITKYEILRGLEAKSAGRQIETFKEFSSSCEILGLTDEIIELAAKIYANLRRRGELIGDADILIAATALVQNFGIVTNNESHYSRIEALIIENWLKK